MKKYINISFNIATQFLVFSLVFSFLKYYEYWGYLSAFGFLPLELNDALKGIIHQVIFCFQLLPFIYIVTLALSAINQTLGNVFSLLLYLLLLFLEFGLGSYYIKTNIPLDHSLFAYNFDEVLYIINTSTSNVWITLLPFLIITAVYIACFFTANRYFSKRIANILEKRGRTYVLSGLTLCFLLLLPLIIWTNVNFIYDRLSFAKSDKEYHAFLCKSARMLKYTYWYFYEWNKKFEDTTTPTARDFKTFQAEFPDLKFINDSFPLLHVTDTNSTLSPFFSARLNKPNIVIIMVEGLSKSISGEDAEFGSYTPFLDSIARESLYWPNCLSTSERTFQFLPSVLGSLPYARKGFCDQPFSIPLHLSLLSILKERGYTTNFFYTGWNHWDKADVLLNSEHVDNNITYFGEKPVKPIHDKDEFYWGFADETLYKRYYEVCDSLKTSPRIDILQTISTHEPYTLQTKDQDKYLAKADDIYARKREKTEYYKKLRPTFATFLYADDQIKSFITEYSRRPDFDNTIFIITGDHEFHMFSDNSLRLFHVPLIIYSPLLKKPREFASVASHREICPSILSLLHKNYQTVLPPTSHWCSNQLDTTKEFTCNISMPFIFKNRDIDAYIYNGWFYSRGKLYRVDKNLGVTPVQNTEKLDILQYKLETYKIVNYWVCNKNRITPGTAYFNTVSVDTLYTYSLKQINRRNISNKKSITSLHLYQKWYNLTCYLPITRNYKSITVQITGKSFCYKAPSSSKQILIAEINRDGKYLNAVRVPVEISRDKKWNDVNFTFVYDKTMQFKQGDKIRFYIQNQGLADLVFNDFEVMIFCK